jgi:RNA polymerase sigma-70 factor, ECF subfamily
MNSAQYSLLARLQSSRECQESWTKFIQIYAPLLDEWTRRLRVPEQDRQDLVQETFVKLLTRMDSFQRSPGGSFRAWLYTMLRNGWLDQLRRRSPRGTFDCDFGDPRLSDPQEAIESQEYHNYVLRRVYDLVIADFPAATQIAFQSYVLDGRPADEVSRELGISTNALYLMRGRVLRRLKAELAGLVEQ